VFAGITDEAIFVADYQTIYMASLRQPMKTRIRLPLKNLLRPIAIALDPFENRIYWTDLTNGVVGRSSINGKDQEIIHSGMVRPMGIALDLLAGNVYWVNNGNDTIEVSKLNGKYRKVLISNLTSPYAIALDTSRG